MRPQHYIKNALILAPLVFGDQLLNTHDILPLFWAIVIFCLLSSVVYIINDIRDMPNDRRHPVKKHRPLAAGEVTTGQAVTLAVFLTSAILVIGYLTHISVVSWLLLGSYLLINLAYSFGLKNIPIIDIALLAAGFVIRVLYGASIINVEVSHWLYMTVLAGAFYVSLGKRRNEIISSGTKSRKVNEAYPVQFLDKYMYVCLALTLVFYSLWATDPARMDTRLYATIPFVILLFMTYSLTIEQNNSSGDPVDVFAKSKILQICVPICITFMILLVYIK